MKWLILIAFLCPFAFGADVYFAQSAAGSGNGSNCANAESLATFNGGTATAGNTYHLCGTLTSAVTVPTCTSGSVSTKCELLFDSGSAGNITAAALPATGAIVVQNFWIVDGGTACGTTGPTSNFTTWQTSCASGLTGTGFISNTANGTGLANQIATLGITSPSGIHDIEIRNLICNNLYQKSGADISTGAQNTYCISLVAPGTNILIHDNALNMVNTGIYVPLTGSSTNTRVYQNVVTNNKWGIVTAQGTGISTGTYVYNNDINIGTAWNTDFNNGNPYHTDFLFLFGQDSSNHMNGAYIYGNYFHGAGGSHNGVDGLYYCATGMIYDNQNQAAQYIFNNVFNLTSGYLCSGIIATGYSSTGNFIFNNTFVGFTAATCFANNGGGVCVANSDAGANASSSTSIENNITYNLNSNITYNHSGIAGFTVVDYNDYFGFDTHGIGPWNDGTEYDTLAAWQALTCGSTGCDAHSSGNNPNLTATFHLSGSSSPAWQTATNLFSTCNGQPTPGLGALCFDAAGTIRPAGGAWDMGAFEDSATSVPSVLGGTLQNGAEILNGGIVR